MFESMTEMQFNIAKILFWFVVMQINLHICSKENQFVHFMIGRTSRPHYIEHNNVMIVFIACKIVSINWCNN